MSRELTFSYDSDADVLYAVVGSPWESIYDAVGGGVYVRRDSKTNHYTGFLILSYAKQIKNGTAFSIPHFEHVNLPGVGELPDKWSQLSETEKKHILEGLDDYIAGRYEEFETVDDLIEDLHSKEN